MNRNYFFRLKRIELFISPEQVNDVLQIFDDLKLEATLYNLHGLGKSRRLSIPISTSKETRFIAGIITIMPE